MYPTTLSVGNFSVDADGVVKVGNLTIEQDGSIFCKGVKILDATTGKIGQNSIDFSIGGEVEQASLIDMNTPEGTYHGSVFDF